MRRPIVLIATGLSLTLTLSGCDLFASTQATAPPPPAAAIVPRAVETSTPTSAPGGTAIPGDIIFVSNGQLLAIGADGSSEHVIYTPEQGAVVRNLAISTDGRYLAFTLNTSRAMVLDLTLGQVTKIDESATNRFGSFAWSPAGDALFYQRLVLDANSKPAHSQVVRASMPPGSPPQKVLDYDLASNLPIRPVAVWRGGLVILQQVDAGGGALGQWLVYDPVAQSVTPLLKDYGLWDVSADRTQMLLFNTADLVAGPQSGSAPVYTAALDLARGAIGVTRIPLGDQPVHLESARFAPDGLQIAALQSVGVDGAVRRQIVLLSPGDNSSYRVIRLSPDDSAEDVALTWDTQGLIVQRLRGGQPELWLVPLDGSAGTLLAPGEQPVAVSPR